MTARPMLEVLSRITSARRGTPMAIKELVVTYLYALKNAIKPTLTVIGLTFAIALTGTFFVEIIFNWAGLGLFTVRLLIEHRLSRLLWA